jgi:hypothetical protein
MENILARNILIGSRALDYWYDLGIAKPNSDWDVISTKPIEGTEWHDPWLLNNDAIHNFTSPEHTIDFNGNTLYVCKLQGLALIKRSHLWRDLGFSKHITMYHKYLADYLDLNITFNRIFLNERTRMTMERFPQQGPNLNQTVENFFDDAVTKVYNHDMLHSLFAYQEQPMYTRLQTDSTKAWCSKELWDDLTHLEQLQCVAEETYVIATERFMVPKDWKYPAKLAYNKALNKVCTTLCKNWFRDKAIDYYPEVMELFDEGKFLSVKDKLSKI